MLKFIIKDKGKPVVGESPAHVVVETPEIIAAEIDMTSKWCVVDYTGSSGDGLEIGIGVQDRSCHLNDSASSTMTSIQFPDHRAPDWDVFVAECSRYTLRVVLTRRD